MLRDPYLSLCTILRFRWNEGLNINPDTLHLIEEKVGDNLKYICTRDIFLKRTTIAWAIRQIIHK